MAFPFIAGGIAVIIVVLALVAIPNIRKQREIIRKTGKYPEGYFIGQGMGFGLAIGLPLGVAMGNVALGPALGLPIGLAIGQSMEKKYKDKIRPPTKEEKEMKRKMIFWVVGSLIVGVGALMAAMFLA